MLEIFILVAMCRYLHRTATNKGYVGWPFAVVMVFSWFIGGIGGAIGGLMLLGDGGGELPIGAIVGYLLGVALGCIGNALLVAVLPARERPDDDDDDRRRRRFDDDDDPRDSRRRRRYDDDYDRDDRRGRYDDDRDDRRR